MGTGRKKKIIFFPVTLEKIKVISGASAGGMTAAVTDYIIYQKAAWNNIFASEMEIMGLLRSWNWAVGLPRSRSVIHGVFSP